MHIGQVPRIASIAAILFLVLVVAIGSDANEHGKNYEYQLEGFVDSREISKEKPQRSGLALKSRVQLIYQSALRAQVKFIEPQIATYNDIISDFSQYELNYQPIDESGSLSKAFSFQLDAGQLVYFTTAPNEPKWISNLKRGLISLFQFDVANNEDAYTVKEKSVIGECDTDYVVARFGDYTNITKTRNFEKCNNRYFKSYLLSNVDDCNECNSTSRLDAQKFKHASAAYSYTLKSTGDDNDLVEATMNDWVRFSPFGLSNHRRLIDSRFKLSLLNKLDNSFDVEATNKNYQINYDAPDAVESDFYSSSINMEDAHYLKTIYDQQASVENVLEAIDAVVKDQRAYLNSAEGTNDDKQFSSMLPEQFSRLVNHMATLDGSKLESLFAEVDAKGESHKRVFFDAVSATGTNPTFMFMKKQIENGDLPAKRQQEFLSRVSFTVKVPSKALFEEYINLCKFDKIATNQDSMRLCTLPLASLIYQHCVKPHAKLMKMKQAPREGMCTLETAEEFYNKIMSMVPISGESTVGEKMLAIKLSGEMAIKRSLEMLTGYLKNQSEHPSLRAAALWNMKKVAKLYPEEVKKIAKPLFFNRNELLEVRIAAFYNWWYLGIELHEMEHLAKQLKHEPSRHLVSYMSSLITSASKLDVPCFSSFTKVAQHASLLMKDAKRDAYMSPMSSMAHLSSSWLKDYEYGSANTMSVIYSNESFAPINLYYGSAEFMSGLKLSPMTISVQAHGLDKLIKKVIGINGMISDKENLLDLFSLKKRQKRQATDKIKQEIQDIDKGIELNTRDFGDVYIALTISAYGRIVNFMDIDSKKLKTMASEDGTIKIPNLRKVIQAFDNFTSQSMKIPFTYMEMLTNQIGLPVFQEFSSFDYKNFKLRNIKFDIEPGFFKDERAGKPVTKIQGSIDARLNKQGQMFAASGVWLGSTKEKLGVGFVKRTMMNVPINMSMEASMADNKIIIKRQPIHENLYYMKMYPVSFIQSNGLSEALKDDRSLKGWRPFYDASKPKQMKPFEFEFMTPLAIGIKLEGKHRADQDYSRGAWTRYLASQGLRAARFAFTHSPMAEPIEMKVSTITTKDSPTKEMTTTLSWKHYHEDDLASDKRTPEESELEKFTNKDGQARPTTVSYGLVSEGGPGRHLSLSLHYSRSADRLAHKWYVNYARSAVNLGSPQAEPTNICWLGEVQFPKYAVDKFLALDLVGANHTATLNSDMTFGQECTPVLNKQANSAVSLRASFDWSHEQRDMITRAQSTYSNEIDDYDTVSKNKFVYMYNRCMKNRKQFETPVDQACLQYLYKATELTNVQADFEYRNFPENYAKMLKRLGSLYTMARATYIDEMEDSKQCTGTGGKARLEANMTSCSMDRRLTFKFDSPAYRVTFKNLPIAFSPMSSYPLFDQSYYKMLVKRQSKNRFCSIGGNSVTTYDNMTMSLPAIPDGCFKVLSKDCSPEKNFMVLGAKQGQGKSMTVYVGQKFKIDFVANSEGTKITDIKVNDASVSVDQSKPYKKDTMFGQKPVEAFEISYNGAFYTLSSRAYQFSAMTDGTWILVNQGKYYAGKSCGICGDDNGELMNELRGPSGCVYDKADDFIWSYTVPSASCKSRPTIKSC